VSGLARETVFMQVSGGGLAVDAPSSGAPTSDAGSSTGERPISGLRGYSPGLDGLRAVGMAFMLGFHAEMPWSKGAFLALSQFFTLSGFLVMTVLLNSARGTGRVDLRRFWTRRIRRLVPGLLMGLAVIVVYGATVADASQADVLPRQVAGAALNVSNWLFVADGTSYVDQFASPSPVRHFWSLSVEEQFYLVLPLLFVGVLAATRSRRVLVAVMATLCVASAAWMAFLGVRGAGIDRLYYGTDTRLAEMLAGVVAALLLDAGGRRLTARAWVVLGWAGAVAYVGALIGLATVPLEDGPIWRGGILLFAVSTVLVILGILGGHGPLRALGWGPLAAMGRITYGLYLYHLPIFLWLTEERTGLSTWPLFALRLAVTFAMAIASYHWLEMPVRTGRWFSSGRVRFAAWPVAAVLLIVACILTAGGGRADPLAALRGESVTPDVVGDGVVDVLVLADDTGEDVVEALAEGAEDGAEDGSPPLRIVRGGDVDCGSPRQEDGAWSCGAWEDTWPGLIAEHDPDVVLLWMSDLPGLDAVDPSQDSSEVASQLMRSGIDLLSAEGANVVWSTVPLNFLQLANRPPFHRAMIEALTSEPALRSAGTMPLDGDVVDVERSVSVLRDALPLYQRIPDDGRVRIMVVGDSQARAMGYGLELFFADRDDAQVWNVAANGCGILNDGESEGLFGDEGVNAPAQCRAALGAWQDNVDRFRPNYVLVLSSVRDLQDRRLEGWSGYESPGDADFDRYMVDRYVDAVDVLSSRGARVVWMEAPCVDISADVGDGSTAGDQDRIDHLNEVVLPEVITERPDVVDTYPLDEILCPDGEGLTEVDGISPVRPDGVHLSPDAAEWLAGVLADEVLGR